MSGMENFVIDRKPELKEPTLLVCWNQDAGAIGQDVFKYLNDRLKLTLFAEIEPADFFPLRGVVVDGDVAQFPEGKFYYCSEKDLIIFKSSVPRFEWYKFIQTVLDISQKVCQVKEICTLGGMISISAHTMPRILMATMNKPEIKSILCDFDINLNLDYESPAGQRPTTSSYLIWEAMRRKIPGISIWVPIPFYLVGVNDIRACRRVVDFLNQWLRLGLEFSGIDKQLGEQNKSILQATQAFPEIMETIRKLETNNVVTEDESAKLVEVIEEYLKAGKHGLASE